MRNEVEVEMRTEGGDSHHSVDEDNDGDHDNDDDGDVMILMSDRSFAFPVHQRLLGAVVTSYLPWTTYPSTDKHRMFWSDVRTHVSAMRCLSGDGTCFPWSTTWVLRSRQSSPRR